MPPSKRSAESIWRGRDLRARLLLPISLLYRGLTAIRRRCYQFGGLRGGLRGCLRGCLRSTCLPVPVVVVGNITAGGAGKTPLVIYLVEALKHAGRRPGVVSRGYGGSVSGVCEVRSDSSPDAVGDEPLLIHQRTGCPVFVGRQRVVAGAALLQAYPDCDLILCDDGLQHYSLARDLEIAVVDRRGFGNGWLLPAGPLREPVGRLGEVDAVVSNGWPGPAAFRMVLQSEPFRPLVKLSDGDTGPVPLEQGGRRWHAVAGIGEPQRFFDQLSALGLVFEAHAFPDHHHYQAGDLAFDGDAILTTEKDAVKFSGLTTLPVWVLPVSAQVTPDLAQFILEKIDGPSAA